MPVSGSPNDSRYSLYDKKKTGDFGRKETRRDEVTDVKAVGSQIANGGDLTLLSGGDQTYQGAKLDAGKDLALVSGGAVSFGAVKDLHQESHEKSKGDLAWQSAKGKGRTDETLRQSQLMAQGNLAIKAADGLKIDVKHIDQKTVSETIDAMVQADPQLAWLKQMEQRGDVDWRKVQEVHDSFKYSHSGLGVGAQLAIAIVVTYFTAGAASGAIATAGAGTSMAGATAVATATTSAGWLNAAGTAALSGMASNGAISTINNRGNLGDVVKDVSSSDALRGYVVAGTTAGLTAGVYDKWTSTQTGTSTALPNTGAVAPAAGLGTWQGVGQFTSNQLLQNGTSVLLDRALGGKGSLGDALQNSLANAFAAYGFNLIGDTTHGVLGDGSVGKIGLHALMGGLAAEAAGGDFRTGALAAGVNEALVDSLAKQYASLPTDDRKGLLVMSSQLIGVLAAATQGDADPRSLQTGAWAAGNSTQYNFLNHQDVADLDRALQKCKAQGNCSQVEEEFKARSDENRKRLDGCVAAENCAEIRAEIDAGSFALNDLVTRQETANPGGIDSDLAEKLLMSRNVVDWTTAGQLHLEQTANLWWNGDPQWQKEVGAYLDQTGFNPFGFGVPAMGGIAGKVPGKALMDALKVGELPKGEAIPGKVDLPAIGAEGSVFSGKNIEDLSNAGKLLDPADKSGQLSLAGRALQKHGSREGSAFPSVKGSPSEINAQGQKIADEILNNPASTVIYKDTGRFGKVMDVIAPDGRGLRYDSNGKFIGLLEPPKP